MKTIGVKRTKELDSLAVSLRDSAEALETAVQVYRDAVTAAWDELETSIDHYNKLVDEANEYRDTIHGEISDFIDNKSDKWQEGDKGQAYQQWLGQWETEFDRIEIEKPEDLDLEPQDMAQTLEDLPKEIEE